MHKATKAVKVQFGGHCRLISELEEGRYLVSSTPEISNVDSDDIQAVGGIHFYLVENDFVRLAEEQEIRMGHFPTLMKRLRELEKASGNPIYNLFEKFSFQVAGMSKLYSDAYAKDEDQRTRMRAYTDWINDGKPTGIRSNQEFYALQMAYFGNIVYDFD